MKITFASRIDLSSFREAEFLTLDQADLTPEVFENDPKLLEYKQIINGLHDDKSVRNFYEFLRDAHYKALRKFYQAEYLYNQNPDRTNAQKREDLHREVQVLELALKDAGLSLSRQGIKTLALAQKAYTPPPSCEGEPVCETCGHSLVEHYHRRLTSQIKDKPCLSIDGCCNCTGYKGSYSNKESNTLIETDKKVRSYNNTNKIFIRLSQVATTPNYTTIQSAVNAAIQAHKSQQNGWQVLNEYSGKLTGRDFEKAKQLFQAEAATLNNQYTPPPGVTQTQGPNNTVNWSETTAGGQTGANAPSMMNAQAYCRSKGWSYQSILSKAVNIAKTYIKQNKTQDGVMTAVAESLGSIGDRNVIAWFCWQVQSYVDKMTIPQQQEEQGGVYLANNAAPPTYQQLMGDTS